MILDTIDFKPFFEHIESIFSSHFPEEEVQKLMEFVEILADANFKCYIANMKVIANRKSPNVDDTLIADLEWVARSVGEYRVASKANINKYVSMFKSVNEPTSPDSWVSDDIVYSIGEMMDRLSIETIKREDFRVNNRPAHMTEATLNLSNRVEIYLRTKLAEIDAKGFYECNNEQRTYDLEGIIKDLAL